ncbi:MAG: tRNA pseudouridine(38-40) synthase TruA [Steroidobacteraceae bacterium]
MDAAVATTRIRLDLSYDGTAFAGWAQQRDQRTVQGVLTEALEMIVRSSIALTVAGRTDSGVHATGQVAHFDVPLTLWNRFRDGLLRRVNAVLPDDIRVHRMLVVPEEFNARFAALRRHYRYRIDDSPEGGYDPLRRQDTLSWPRRLDLAAMNSAAQLLLGEHDFAAFCRRKPQATTIRCLQELRWERECMDAPASAPREIAVAHVAADAFCHSMVRSLVGAMLAVGESRRAPEWPGELLKLSERASSVTVAPAHGLTLVRVDYPDDSKLADRSKVTRRMRDR